MSPKLSSIIPSAAETAATVRNFHRPSVIKTRESLKNELDSLSLQVATLLRQAMSSETDGQTAAALIKAAARKNDEFERLFSEAVKLCRSNGALS